ncbi:hypothetical protein MMC07_004021 [Pseudocyphellaria aurata]|nr:hypothetical protein [Pseudocyphellaria aurata]
MDSLKNAVGLGDDKTQGQSTGQTQPTGQTGAEQTGGGFFGGIGDKLNSAAGGGKESEKNEDLLDKGVWEFLPSVTWGFLEGKRFAKKKDVDEKWIRIGVDYVQQAMGGGDQSNETAAEQFKDEQISDMIRSQYKSVSGKDFPIEDKER